MRIWALLAAGAIASVAALATVMLAAPGWAGEVAADAWGQALAELVAAGALALAAAHTRGRARQVWVLLAVAEAVWAITDATYAALTMAGTEVPEVSALDAGWLGYYVPAGLAAALMYRRMRPERGWQGAIDGLIVTLAVAAVGWVTLIADRAGEGSGGTIGTLVASLYPSLDLICAAALGWVLMRHGRRAPVWLRLVVAAFATQCLAGLGYLAAALDGASGDLVSAGVYMAAAWCWVAAGVARVRAPERAWAAGRHDRPPRWSETTAFSLGAMVVAIAALAPDVELRIGAVVVSVLMAVRAVAALWVVHALLADRERMLGIDTLTGVHNRRFLGEELVRALSRADRDAAPLSLIALDLDRFKDVNDRFGHGVGDELLRAVSAALAAELRDGDVLCRLGGDEFVVLCDACGADEAATVAERLRRGVLAAAAAVVPEVAVSASLGVATHPVHARSQEELLARADEALYAAKGGGRNAVVVWHPDRPVLEGARA